jgi:excisionase family DNA binding protein
LPELAAKTIAPAAAPMARPRCLSSHSYYMQRRGTIATTRPVADASAPLAEMPPKMGVSFNNGGADEHPPMITNRLRKRLRARTPMDAHATFEHRLLTLREVADYLRLGPSTVYRLSRTMHLPAFKIGGTWRISIESLHQWLEQTERSGGSAMNANVSQPLGEVGERREGTGGHHAGVATSGYGRGSR